MEKMTGLFISKLNLFKTNIKKLQSFVDLTESAESTWKWMSRNPNVLRKYAANSPGSCWQININQTSSAVASHEL